jgi:hypothetical protein
LAQDTLLALRRTLDKGEALGIAYSAYLHLYGEEAAA